MARTLETILKAQDLIQIHGLAHCHGPLSQQATSVAPASNPCPGSLVFVSSELDLIKASEAGASIILASRNFALPKIRPDVTIFLCAGIPQAMADVLKLVDPKYKKVPPGISTSARIHSSAKVGSQVSIGEFVVVGENTVIGDNTILSHHVVIERGATLGSNCFLHSSVVIGADCILGSRVEIHSHSTIGSDGFGLVTQKDKTHQKIPQIGIVVLEDDVEIGANCAIDRATLDETRICKGTKFDNLVHIAHNCKIGPNSRIAAGFFLAGSSQIGANFLTGGSTVVADHVVITDNVTLGGKSVVTKDITEPGVYAGYPLEPLKEAMRSIANIANITHLRKQLAEIRKHLGLKG